MRRATIFITFVTVALLCVSHLFAQNNQSMTIVIDPGHGGYDPGAVATLNGKQYRECDIALNVALKAGAMIEKNMPQVKVIYTRSTDKHWSTNKTRDLQARVDIANKADAGLFLSIHCNAAKATSASGAVTLIMGESSAKRIQQNADVIEDAYRDDLVDMCNSPYCRIVTHSPICSRSITRMLSDTAIAARWSMDSHCGCCATRRCRVC